MNPQKRNMSGLKRGGSTGRKKGVPNKVTVEVKEACALIVDDPVYRTNLTNRAKRGKLHPSMETMLWHYAKGKPKETIELRGTVEIAGLSDSELRERIAAFLAKL